MPEWQEFDVSMAPPCAIFGPASVIDAAEAVVNGRGDNSNPGAFDATPIAPPDAKRTQLRLDH